MMLQLYLVFSVLWSFGFGYPARSNFSPFFLNQVHGNTAIDRQSAIGPRLPAGARVPILMYHHVGLLPDNPSSIRRDLTVSSANFELQVQWLKDNGFSSVSLEEIYMACQGQINLPNKPVALTFDDGYADVFTNALPILQKYGFIASFAVVPGLLGQLDYANWEQVENAKKAGMEIVSHTETHFDGSSRKFDVAFIKADLAESLKQLDNHLGSVPRILVYPYGHYTQEYIEVAESLGFKMALTTNFGDYIDPANLMRTPRVRVHGNESLARFVEIITGAKAVTLNK